MKRLGRWFKKQTRDHPFRSALFLLLLVITPGYGRLENAVDKINTAAADSNKAAASAEETAKQLVEVTKREDLRDQRVSLENCQTRNTAAERGRERFATFFNVFETIVNSDPDLTEEARQRSDEFFANLRASVPLDPSKEDVDCNADGVLDLEDYAT